MTKKKRNIIIIVSVFAPAVMVAVPILGLLLFLTYSEKLETLRALKYYVNDQSYIQIVAQIDQAEESYNSYWGSSYLEIRLKYDGNYRDLRYAEAFDIIVPNVNVLKENGFIAEPGEKYYKITVGRRTISDGPNMLMAHPIVALSELDDDKVYLDFKTGKINLISFIQTKMN